MGDFIKCVPFSLNACITAENALYKTCFVHFTWLQEQNKNIKCMHSRLIFKHGACPFWKGTVSESGTGPLDYEATGPVPDPEPRLWGLSRSPVVCELLDKSRDTGCVSVPARICSNSYFTNKNSCWSFTLLRPPSSIICIYCHTIQTSISLYKMYKIFSGQEWKKHN